MEFHGTAQVVTLRSILQDFIQKPLGYILWLLVYTGTDHCIWVSYICTNHVWLGDTLLAQAAIVITIVQSLSPLFSFLFVCLSFGPDHPPLNQGKQNFFIVNVLVGHCRK